MQCYFSILLTNPAIYLPEPQSVIPIRASLREEVDKAAGSQDNPIDIQYNCDMTACALVFGSSSFQLEIGIGVGNLSGATGKTTFEMQTQSTFTNAGWDFVDEIDNGTSTGCVTIDTQTLLPSLDTLGWDVINNDDDGILDLWCQQADELPKLFWQWQPADDVDYNGVVDTGDLVVMMFEWLTDEQEQKRLLGDVNLDGEVTLEDFAIISGQWTVDN